MAEYLLDTNVLSKIFYGDLEVKRFVDNLHVGIETIAYIESIQGSISKKDRELIKRSLAKIEYYSLTPEIALDAIDLIDKYSASHGLFLADALIAATAIYYDLSLLTYNAKHFLPIEGLTVVEPKL